MPGKSCQNSLQNSLVRLGMGRHNSGMKNSPNVVPASAAQPQAAPSLARFWTCFFLCLLILGVISGMMLAGFFMLMGYRVF
jgi:hypothetical protein